MTHFSNWIPRRSAYTHFWRATLFIFPFCFDRNTCFVWNMASIYLDSLECTMLPVSSMHERKQFLFYHLKYLPRTIHCIQYAVVADHTLSNNLKTSNKNELPIWSLVSVVTARLLLSCAAVIMSCKINNNERVQVKLDFGGIYPLYGVIRTVLVI